MGSILAVGFSRLPDRVRLCFYKGLYKATKRGYPIAHSRPDSLFWFNGSLQDKDTVTYQIGNYL